MFDIPSGYRVRPYRFADEQAEKCFNASQQPSGSIILYDLVRFAQSAGIKDVPIPRSSRSKFSVDMLSEPLKKYFTKPCMSYDNEMLYKACRKVSRALFLGGKLKPQQLGEMPMDPSKSAGAPTFGKKGEVLPEEVKRARRLLRGEAPPPVTVFHRGKNDEVARPVFGYPASVTLIENMFFHPYQREVMRHHNPYVGGRSYPQLSGDLNELRWKSRWFLELDYSGFDGSISARLIQLAFDIIAESFEMSVTDKAAWDFIVKYFVTCPVLLPDGNMLIGKRHGVPSGSAFTQLIDSVVNAICIEYAALRTQTNLSRFYVMGDDSVVGVKGVKPSLKAWASAIAELGITVNPEKSKLCHRDDDAYFLGHYWASFAGTRTREETWHKLLTPERPDPRFFRRGTEDQKAAFIERLEAYRLDNHALWGELNKVIMYLRNVIYPNAFGSYSFNGSKAFDERARWDMSIRHMKRRASNLRWYSAIQYYFIARPASGEEIVY